MFMYIYVLNEYMCIYIYYTLQSIMNWYEREIKILCGDTYQDQNMMLQQRDC